MASFAVVTALVIIAAAFAFIVRRLRVIDKIRTEGEL
jgi:hypothetical protein